MLAGETASLAFAPLDLRSPAPTKSSETPCTSRVDPDRNRARPVLCGEPHRSLETRHGVSRARCSVLLFPHRDKERCRNDHRTGRHSITITNFGDPALSGGRRCRRRVGSAMRPSPGCFVWRRRDTCGLHGPARHWEGGFACLRRHAALDPRYSAWVDVDRRSTKPPSQPKCYAVQTRSAISASTNSVAGRDLRSSNVPS